MKEEIKLSKKCLYIKRRIVEFWKSHKDFDDRNPKHIKEAEQFLKELTYDFPPQMILKIIEEMRNEAEKEVEKARTKFYQTVKKLKEG